MPDTSIERLAPVEIDREPRILDLDLAARLGFADRHKIRQLITRNIDELRTYGGLSAIVAETQAPGRPGRNFWLNEPQALLVCMFSNTGNAAAVRKQVIDVFMDWRVGKTVHVNEHMRRPPSPPALPAYEFAISQRGAGDPISVKATVPLSMALQFMDIFKTRAERVLELTDD